MKATTIKLLIKWISIIMNMLCERADLFSLKDRTELAEVTADLTGALVFDEVAK